MKLTNSEWHVLNESLALAQVAVIEHPNHPLAGKIQEAVQLLADAKVEDGFRFESNSLLARMLPAGAEGFAV